MRWMLWLALAACEKSGPIETSGGSSSHEASATPVAKPPQVATIPNDAAVAVTSDAAVAVASDAAVAVRTDAAIARVPAPSRTSRAEAAKAEADAQGLADLLTADPGRDLTTGDINRRRPNADLGGQ